MNATPEPNDDPLWCNSLLSSGKRTWQYEKRFALWMLAWAVVVGICMYLLRHDLVASPYNWFVASIPLILIVLPLRAYYIFYRHADELIRKIQMEAVAVGFFVGVTYAMAHRLLEAAGLQPASAADTGVMMLFAFGFAQIYGAWKYR
jgi:hypothetical protein